MVFKVMVRCWIGLLMSGLLFPFLAKIGLGKGYSRHDGEHHQRLGLSFPIFLFFERFGINVHRGKFGRVVGTSRGKGEVDIIDLERTSDREEQADDDGWHHQRQTDFPRDHLFARPVDAGCLEQVFRNADKACDINEEHVA